MRFYLPFVIIGLTTGAVYAIASLGLVLTYKTSGVFNFAHGAVGMFATYVFYTLRVDVRVPTPAAVLVCVLVVAPCMGVAIDRLLLRRLDGATAATYVVASLGLLVFLQGLAVKIYGPSLRQVKAIFPRATYRLPGVNVGVDQTVIVAIALGLGLGLIAFFRLTRLGLLTRAVVDDKALLGLTGTDGAAVTTFSWMLGCAFAALSGILFAPFIGLDSLLLTLLVVEAFGAAVVGRLRSLPITMVAAFGIGVIQSLIRGFISRLGGGTLALSGLPTAVPFLTLFAVLVFSRRGSFVEATTVRTVASGEGSRSGRSQFPVLPLAIAGGFAALLPFALNGTRLVTLTVTVAFVLIFISLSVLVGQSRQVSLAHAVFVAFGATTLSHLLSAGVPYLLALPLAGLLVVPLGALLAIPAIRLSGPFLALATFGFGLLAQNMLFSTVLVYGSYGTAKIPRPAFLAGDKQMFYFVLAVTILGVLAIELVRATRLGRVLAALGDSPRAVESLGVNPVAARVLTFCLSTFLAALAGGLLGTVIQSVNNASFTFFHSLLWVAVLVAAGSQTFSGSVLAAVLVVAVPNVIDSRFVTDWQSVFFGLAAILLAQTQNGLVGFARRSAQRLTRLPEHRGMSGRSLERLLRLTADETVASRSAV